MKRLLLVDGHLSFTNMLSRVLIRRGYTVVAAFTAQEALRHLDEMPPDYAVVETHLEQFSGLELIGPLRAANKSMRIIILTGYPSIATTVEAIKLGADNYLAKEMGAEAVVAALQGAPAPDTTKPGEPMSLRRLKSEHIRRVLAEHHGDTSATAHALGISPRTVQRWIAKRRATGRWR